MSLKDALLAMGGFPARFEEQKDGSLTLDFVAAERKTMLSSRKATYHCRVGVDEPGKSVLFYEILKEKGAGISSGDEDGPGFGFKKETYKITGKERSGTIRESSTFLGQGYSLSFDYGLIRDTIRREAEAAGYTFSVTLRESSVTNYKSGVNESGMMSSPAGARAAAGGKVKPSRWYYGLSFLLLVAGGIMFGLFLSNSINGIAGSLQRMVMPRSYYITLTEAGRYTVFHEYRSTVGGRMYATEPNLRGMRALLVSEGDGRTGPAFPAFGYLLILFGVCGCFRHAVRYRKAGSLPVLGVVRQRCGAGGECLQ